VQRLVWRLRHSMTKSPAGVPTRRDDDLSPRQRQENAWRKAGWLAVSEPTAAAPGGRDAKLWARRGELGLVRLFGGRVPPTDTGAARFYVNNGKVYGDEGHPDGSSSVPYYTVRSSYMYPGEGYPSGPDDRIHYRVRHLHERCAPNPRGAQRVLRRARR
jgi:hypothetical protein